MYFQIINMKVYIYIYTCVYDIYIYIYMYTHISYHQHQLLVVSCLETVRCSLHVSHRLLDIAMERGTYSLEQLFIRNGDFPFSSCWYSRRYICQWLMNGEQNAIFWWNFWVSELGWLGWLQSLLCFSEEVPMTRLAPCSTMSRGFLQKPGWWCENSNPPKGRTGSICSCECHVIIHVNGASEAPICSWDSTWFIFTYLLFQSWVGLFDQVDTCF